MSFGFIPLASSSKGNATLIETPQTRVVVDIGISFKRFRKELEAHHISLATIDRLYITHAHADHMSGLEQFLRQTNIPVFTRRKTLDVLRKKFSSWSFDLDRVELIAEPVHLLKDLVIRYFRLPHEGWSDNTDDDTGDHIGFVFEWQGKKLSFMTDCGHLTDGVKQLIKASDAY
jgi:phosphoribosyl 1,2-cyclic phosphodiesterase